MKLIHMAIIAGAFVSSLSFAQTISATDSTLDSAEAKIAEQAAEQGLHYRITSTQYKNQVHITAELSQ